MYLHLMVITEQLKTTIKQYGHFMVRHFTETGYRGTDVELHDKRDGFSFLLFTLNVVVYPSISVPHILCYVFALFSCVLCTLCCQFFWIVHV